MPTTSQWRRRALREWRGLPEIPPVTDRAVAVADLVEPVLQQLGLENRLLEEKMQGHWRELVGDFISQHAKPLKLQQRTLYVQVLQPTIRYELETRWRREILEKMQRCFGAKKIRDLRFVLG